MDRNIRTLERRAATGDPAAVAMLERNKKRAGMPTEEDIQRAIKDAARRLVNGFSCVPYDWARVIAEHIDGDEAVALPMWGTLFKVEDSCDERKIRDMMRPIGVSTEDDIDDIREFVEERGLGIDVEDYSDGDEDEPAYDIDELVYAVMDAWRDSYDEDCAFADSGWQEVGDTGILAREFDGHLLLGINGAGYDFYERHWMTLYRALGYEWHGISD